jgi:hypothetical protein
VIQKNVVLIIPDPKLLKGIGGIYHQQGFSVFPFENFENIPDSLFQENYLFVWDIEEVQPENQKWIEYLKVKKTVKFILIDFQKDSYINQLIDECFAPERIYDQSYKVRDLLHMSDMVFDPENPFLFPASYIDPGRKIYEKKFKNSSNYLVDAEKLINAFLKENHLEKHIHDLDVFFLALGEVVENFVEYQMIHLKRQPDITVEYGVDMEKIVISVRDELGEANFSSLFESFIRKTSIAQKKAHLHEHYTPEGIFVGPRGRGMAIIKKGVHRLISIIKKSDDPAVNKRTQFIFILYIDKKKRENNSSVNMLVYL